MRTTVNANSTGTNFSRYLMALARTKSYAEAASYADRTWPDSPEVSLVLRSETLPVTIGSAPAFLGHGLGRGLLYLMESYSIVSRLAPSMRRVPMGIAVPRQLTGITVTIVNENAPITLHAPTFETATLTPFKLAAIVPVSNDLLHSNGPAVELS